jgi:hypothetical protein
MLAMHGNLDVTRVCNIAVAEGEPYLRRVIAEQGKSADPLLVFAIIIHYGKQIKVDWPKLCAVRSGWTSVE